MTPLFTQGLGSLLGGFVTFSIGRGLLRRRRWAYFGVIGLLSLSMLITFGLALLSILVFARTSPANRGDGDNSVFVILAIVILVQLVYVWLLVRSHGDFYGPKVRLLTEVEAHDHVTHYNNGVTYKKRGMWYMAVKEWEVASKKAPHDLNYLHALGLAYAQIRQFDQARATLDSALKIDPNHMQIKESRALVDQMAKR